MFSEAARPDPPFVQPDPPFSQPARQLFWPAREFGMLLLPRVIVSCGVTQRGFFFSAVVAMISDSISGQSEAIQADGANDWRFVKSGCPLSL